MSTPSRQLRPGRSGCPSGLRAALIVAAVALTQVRAGEAGAPRAALESFGPARYVAPTGWSAERKDRPVDPVMRFERDLDVIRIRVLGGKGSRYATPADFLRGFEATTMGHPPERRREIQVAGRKVWLYRHGYPLARGDPHVADPRPPELASEEFCILPVGDRFLVLSFAHESAIPDLDDAGTRAWEALLASVATGAE
jgi:hypothetical protein